MSKTSTPTAPNAPEAPEAPEAAEATEASEAAEAPTADEVAAYFDFDPEDIGKIPAKKTGGARAAELAKYEAYAKSTPIGRIRIFPDTSKTFRSKLSRALTRLETAKAELDNGQLFLKKNYRVGVKEATAKEAEALKLPVGANVTYLHNRTPASTPLPESAPDTGAAT